ncbi:hypothetical protein JY651_51475 [Pyxidicoccus parkwayensis]|uniref:IPT/TIG domain-containing protein n=1 Tax=Pyxidicoccus parkwayensis TaxID=2813578 RepID=A0ABX7P101_9BACT|nr:hypothetical protein [Pyxidicoccus parkwaysis]QSQ23404.1 hypothetical protein JY651_51475 [Pyxidicoccus parkwaysis]
MRLPAAAALLALVACSRTTEGPTPRIQGAINPLTRSVTPPRICNAQGGEHGWRLELAGESFAPVPADVLEDPPVAALPEITLRGPTTLTLTKDHVFYVRPELLLLDVPTRDSTPPVDLPEGSYTLEVSNPVGGSASLADAVVVVGPPSVTGVETPSSGYSFTAPTPIAITGTGFRTGTFPTVVLRGADGTSHSLFVTDVESSTRIVTEIPAGTPEGSYDLLLTSTEGCASSLSKALQITYARLGTLTVAPTSGSELSNQAVTFTNAPAGAQRAFTGAPNIFLLAPLKTNPSEMARVPLRDITYESPTRVTAVVPTCSGFDEPPVTNPACPNGISPGGPYAFEVGDPGGAVGEVPASRGFTVTAGASAP